MFGSYLGFEYDDADREAGPKEIFSKHQPADKLAPRVYPVGEASDHAIASTQVLK